MTENKKWYKCLKCTWIGNESQILIKPYENKNYFDPWDDWDINVYNACPNCGNALIKLPVHNIKAPKKIEKLIVENNQILNDIDKVWILFDFVENIDEQFLIVFDHKPITEDIKNVIPTINDKTISEILENKNDIYKLIELKQNVIYKLV